MSARPFHPQIRVPVELPKSASPRQAKAQGVSVWDLGASELPKSHPEVNPPSPSERSYLQSEAINRSQPESTARSRSHPESSPLERSHPQLQTIAPQQTEALPERSLTPPPESAPPQSAQSQENTSTRRWEWSRRWTILGVMAVGAIGIGLLPLADTVTGEATILSTPGQRQVVTTGRAAKVSAIYVRQNDQVRPGQLLAELSSDELQQQGLEVERKLAEARSEREMARQALDLAIQKERGAQLRIAHGSLRTEIVRQELAGVSPRIGQLQSQQTEKRSQIRGLEAQLAILQGQISRYEGLVQAGALPLAKLDELRREATARQTQRETLGVQVGTLEQQIALVRQEMQDELNGRRQPEVEEARVLARVSGQEIAMARATLVKWEEQVRRLAGQREQLLSQQAGLKLRATVAGVITTADLDVLEGQKVAEGKELLTVAQMTQPTLQVELPQAEAMRLKRGMMVTFRPQDEGLQGFEGKVLEVPPITASDHAAQRQQKAMVGVRVGLTQGQAFTLGTKGYAHVQVGQALLYQKVGREVLKLIPLGRFF